VTFRALGTECRLEFACPRGPEDADAFAAWAREWVNAFEREFSRFIPGSLVDRINRAAGQEWVALDAEAESLFALCDWFHRETNGHFDPTSLPLERLWDYHVEESAPPTPDQIREAHCRVGWQRVQRRPGALFLPEAGMALDVGGIGKEYAVDRVLETAVARGFEDVLVDFGHDLRVHGQPPQGGDWRIGLEDPLNPGRCWGGVAVRYRAVATSGGYRRFTTQAGRRCAHIVDPRLGRPADRGCAAVTVLAPTCTEAGVLAKTAYVLGPLAGLEFLESRVNVEGCLWTETGERLQTRGFDAYQLH
jgi:thiamine biosynthesis lipoprotein